MSHREEWTAAITKRELHANLAKKRTKYGATKVEIDGLVFDSKREAGRWRELVLMQQAGQITDLRRQVRYQLLVVQVGGESASVGEYVADFIYVRDGRRVIEDVKSPATRRIAVYRLKKKIVEANCGLEIQEV